MRGDTAASSWPYSAITVPFASVIVPWSKMAPPVPRAVLETRVTPLMFVVSTTIDPSAEAGGGVVMNVPPVTVSVPWTLSMAPPLLAELSSKTYFQ